MSLPNEFLSLLDDPNHLASLLREKANLILDDSTYFHIANHFLRQPISVEGLAVQRNLYGRQRSSLLTQEEIDLLRMNIKECLHSNSEQLIKPFLQYLHNINRLLPNDLRDIAYLCALILLSTSDKNIIACILCAYLEMNHSNNAKFDWIINSLYTNQDEQDDNPWMDQLSKLIIDRDNQWLRKYYLEKIYTNELLNAIDTHNQENIFKIETIKRNLQEPFSTRIEKLE